ncbi:MAG: EamA family transporter [Anaerolineales bacterium]|jgi:drug/metabolite transporter (DMT)-like permease|nr:EamA family transporter [Anaerolineales bacterium]
MKKTSMMFLFSASLAILASTLYHVFQKNTPGDVNPALSLLVTYATAAVATLGLLVFYPPQNLGQDLAKLNWASYALGLGIVGLELGILLAYRAGWQISLLGLVVNIAAALLLLPVGLIFFREKLTPLNLLGIGLCILGLILVNWRR